MQETLLSFALYGAALYPYFGDPSWILDGEGPDGPMEFTSLASETRRREERSAGARRGGRIRSLLARLRQWLVGSPWQGD